MKDETKEILEVMTGMHDKVMDKLDTIETDISGLKSDVGTLKADVAELKIDVMQITANLAQTETSLYNEIASVHEDLGKRIDNHDGFTKEIDHTMDRVKFIEDHLGLQTA